MTAPTVNHRDAAGSPSPGGEIRRQGTVAAIGEPEMVGGFLLAGVRVYRVRGPLEARAAWRGLPGDVALVVLSPGAAEALSDEPDLRTRLTVAVSP